MPLLPRQLTLRTLAFEIQAVRRIAMGSTAVDVLVACDLTVVDHVDDRHPMAAAQPIILPKPVQNDSSLLLRAGQIPFLCHVNELPWRLARLFFDIVQVRLE